jgi:hypothetical protein
MWASWFSERSFAKLNALADQGSRLAQHIRNLKSWVWGVLSTLWLAATFVDPSKGTGNVITSWIAAHPVLAIAVLGTIMGGVFYLVAKLIERYLLTASGSGRYQPRSDAPAPGQAQGATP